LGNLDLEFVVDIQSLDRNPSLLFLALVDVVVPDVEEPGLGCFENVEKGYSSLLVGGLCTEADV
jgi:hypothetical protein